MVRAHQPSIGRMRSRKIHTSGFIRSVVLQHGDWSVVEHAAVSVDFYVDRGITHEIVRHRLFAFTQESTRFVNYEKKIPPSFVQPAFSG
jgi:thymidylate synthase ThyX